MIGVSWTGWDGSEWNLAAGPVYLTDAGIEGLGSVDSDVFTRETALVDGQRYTGWRGKARRIKLPVLIGQAVDELSWLALDRAWWKTMRPDKYGTLTVTAPDGSKRTIRARFDSDGGYNLKRDPSRDRLSVAPITLTADKPFWAELPYLKSFDNGSTPVNFFGGAAGKATPFIIGAASSADQATLTNTGDIAVWPVYRFTEGITSFRVAIDGKAIAGAIPVPNGHVLQIDSAPQMQVAHTFDANGVKTNVTRYLTSVEFEPIPEGASVRLATTIAGTGTLEVELVPQHFRAW